MNIVVMVKWPALNKQRIFHVLRKSFSLCIPSLPPLYLSLVLPIDLFLSAFPLYPSVPLLPQSVRFKPEKSQKYQLADNYYQISVDTKLENNIRFEDDMKNDLGLIGK